MAAYNTLEIKKMVCPRCRAIISTEAEFRFGFTNQNLYLIGEKLIWGGNGKGHSRPLNGNYTGDGYVECPNCYKDFWLKIFVANDIITKYEVNSEKEGFIK